MTETKVVKIFSGDILLSPPTHTNGNVLYVDSRHIYKNYVGTLSLCRFNIATEKPYDYYLYPTHHFSNEISVMISNLVFSVGGQTIFTKNKKNQYFS